MRIESAVAIVVLMWSVLATAEDAGDFEKGRQLFEQSGCIACHTSSVEDGLAIAGAGYETPPRARILSKLRALGAIIQDRETTFKEDWQTHCQPIQSMFVAEYNRIHNTVLHGNPVFPMPSWHQRTTVVNGVTVSENVNADKDISAVVDYLLVSEGLVLTPATLARWKSAPEQCVNATVQPAASSNSYTNRREVIRERLNVLDQQRHAFEKTPQVTFLSYQNFLMNQVSYVQDGELDIWLLLQAQRSLSYATVAEMVSHGIFPNKLLYAIVVDKGDPSYRAYFFQKPGIVDRWMYRQPKRPVLLEEVRNSYDFIDSNIRDCFGCHASAVLHLRPRQWDGIGELSETDRALMKRFNQYTLGYGPMDIDWPANQKPLTPHEAEPVMINTCQDCHNANSIRSPLLRYHAKTIVALMNAHEDKQGYFNYGFPNPNPLGLPNELKTNVLSVSRRTLSVMPPLSPLTKRENADLVKWLAAPQ
jgi:hypothetical protein